jgi:hypothetical protein
MIVLDIYAPITALPGIHHAPAVLRDRAVVGAERLHADLRRAAAARQPDAIQRLGDRRQRAARELRLDQVAEAVGRARSELVVTKQAKRLGDPRYARAPAPSRRIG